MKEQTAVGLLSHFLPAYSLVMAAAFVVEDHVYNGAAGSGQFAEATALFHESYCRSRSYFIYYSSSKFDFAVNPS